MNSLKDTLETTYAAAAFAERNLPQEALGVQEKGEATRAKPATRAESKTKRPRPSLKA